MVKAEQKQEGAVVVDDRRKNKVSIVLYVFTMLSFIAPIVFLIIRMFITREAEEGAGYHSSADYILMIVQCFLGIIAINIPSFLERKFKFELPVFLYVMYLIFLYCAIFLGEVRSFYYVIPNWDSILHIFSSLMCGFFGFMVITILNKNEHTIFHLSPFFVSLFAFCFSLSVGALWEVYEFTLDGVMGLNMQKFMTAEGTVLTGHEAISDTMKDIIIDSIGALISSVLGFFMLKYNKKLLKVKLVKDEDDKVKDKEKVQDTAKESKKKKVKKEKVEKQK